MSAIRLASGASRHAISRTRARMAPAEAGTIGEAKDIRDKAEAMRLYQKQHSDSLEAQNAAAEIKLWAERRLGELMKAMPKNTGSQNTEPRAWQDASAEIPTYAEQGIEQTEAFRWQKIADVPEPE